MISTRSNNVRSLFHVHTLTAFLSSLLLLTACNGGGGSGNISGQNGGDGGSVGGNPIVTGGGGDAGGGVPPGTNIGSSAGGGSGGGTGGSGGTGNGGGNGGSGTVTLSPVSVSPAVSSSATTRAIAAFPAGSRAGSSGIAILPIDLENTTSFQVIAESFDALVAAALLDPADDILVNFIEPLGTPQQTSAVYLLSNTNTMPYPTSPLDAPIIDGRYSEAVLIVPTANSFSAQVIAKNDPDLARGTLRVNLVLYGSDAQSFRTSIRDSVQVWKAIYQAIGITLIVDDNFTFLPGDGTGILPNPIVGSEFYALTAAQLPTDAINVYIGSGIAANTSITPGDSLDALGVAPSIPGPNAVTRNSAVAIDILSHAGNDGALDNFDIELLGETMAHEVGHYLGLSHIVEFANDAKTELAAGDRLTDTPVCATLTECSAIGAAANLMFPAPVTGVVQQRNLSGQQSQVMQSQVVVD